MRYIPCNDRTLNVATHFNHNYAIKMLFEKNVQVRILNYLEILMTHFNHSFLICMQFEWYKLRKT